MKLFAYLDPGTGSVIIQAVIGAAAGVAFFFRNTLKQTGTKIKNIFKKDRSTDKTK